MRHVNVVARQPHPSGSAEHRRVREYLLEALRGLGLDPQVQEAVGVGTHNSVAAHIWNVIARLPGRQAGGPAVLLAGHYDTVAPAPGAGDDGAAVATLLETLRALRAGPPLEHDIIAIFTDGEEAGLTGSAAFVRDHPWAHDVAVVLNFEGRGTSGPSVMFESSPGNLDAVRTLRRVQGASANSLFVTVARLLPNDSDLSEFLLLGQPALNFGFSDGLERYHSAQDDAAHLNAGSLQHHGVQALALARAFADGPLPRPRTGDALFFTVPGVGIIVYPMWLTTPLVICAGILLVVAGIRLRRHERRWQRDLLVGLAGTIVATALGVAIALGANVAMEHLLGASLDTEGSRGSRALCAVGLVLLLLSVVTCYWILVRRWASAAATHLGTLALWLLVALAITWTIPGASFLFTWPLLVSVAAVLVSAFTDNRRASLAVSWVATLVTIVIIVPVVYAVGLVVFGFGTPGWIVVGVLVPFSLLLIAQRLENLTSHRQWAMALTALMLALAFFAGGAVAFARNPTRITPSLLAYTFDADTRGAWLATLPEFAPPGSWGAIAVGSAARMVTPGKPAAAGGPPEWITRAIGPESRTLASPTQRIAVAVPDLKVVREQSTRTGRRLDLRVNPAADTYSIRIRAVNTHVLSSVLDGRPVDESHYRSPSAQWSLGYVLPPPQGFDLTLNVPANTAVDLDVIARSIGLPRDLAHAIPKRPDGVVQIHAGDQTVVHKHVRF
jgi:peptidase M28-like protein